jgi:hypothetical protein
MCLHYQPETILAYAAAEQMTPADQQLIPQAIATASATSRCVTSAWTLLPTAL